MSALSMDRPYPAYRSARRHLFSRAFSGVPPRFLALPLRSLKRTTSPFRCARMHIGTKEIDKVLLHQVGFIAQKRLARGVKLNLSEATALIATVLQECGLPCRNTQPG